MLGKLFDYSNHCINGFKIINNNLVDLDYLMKHKKQLGEAELDKLDNCNWFLNKAFAYLMPYGYHINNSSPLEACKSVLNVLDIIKHELYSGNLRNNINDYDFILWSLYMEFYNYGSYVGVYYI